MSIFRQIFLLLSETFCIFVLNLNEIKLKTEILMRFTVSSTALSSKLNALARVINSKNSLPILADFLFDIQDNVLRLTASDSENVMKTQLDLTESDGNGRFAVGNHDLL